jgi:Glycosyltransferase family 87
MNREPDRESLRRTLWRLVAIIPIIGVLTYGAFAYRIVSDIAEPESRLEVGTDYSAFHAGAWTLRYGDADQLYDVEALAAVETELRGESVRIEPTYVNPPAFAMLLMPLAPLSSAYGYALWTVLGLAVFGIALRALAVPRPWLVLGVAATTTAGLIGVRIGQGQMFWAALFAAIIWRLRDSALTQAGLFAALLSLKPQLLAPIVLWWLVDWRTYWRALVATIAGSLALALIPAVLFPGVYSGYLSLLSESSASALREGIPWGATFPYTVFAFTGLSTSLAIAGFLVSNAMLVGLVVFAVRAGWGRDTMFVIVTVGAAALAYRLLLYDWMILVPAGAIVAQHIRSRSLHLPAMILALMYIPLGQVFFGIETYRQFGFVPQVASLTLVGVGYVAVREMLQHDGEALVLSRGQ